MTKQLEASRAEMAEMQERLMGFEGERRKLEARDTHIYTHEAFEPYICTHFFMCVFIYVKGVEATHEAPKLRRALPPLAPPPLCHAHPPGYNLVT